MRAMSFFASCLVVSLLAVPVFVASIVAAFALVTPAKGALYDIQRELGFYSYLNQNTLPPALAPYACGPVAVVNSYSYLENKYPGVYGHNLIPDANGDLVYQDLFDLQQVAITLAAPAYMNTTINGTFHDDLIWGKQLYIENQIPGVTIYKAQDSWAWNNPLRPQPAWVASTLPTWDFLYNELVHCEDVEILFSWTEGGHYVTLSSFHWNDVDNDLVIDFGENATIDFVNPWTGALGNNHIWQSYLEAQIETDYASGAWISMVVTESVPEPSACILAGFGLALLCVLRRQRR